jgi:hypothetical protein
MRAREAAAVEKAWRLFSLRGIGIESASASELSQWYERRFGHGSKRLRKIGIVAFGRRLLIALWHWVEQGVVPEGAVLKTNLRLA